MWAKISTVYHNWKGRKLKEWRRLNEIIFIKEMNQLHRKGILLMFDLRCDIPHVLKRLPVRNDLVH
jgi:hypothetical protein